jgi:ribosomal protein L37AE/L43A
VPQCKKCGKRGLLLRLEEKTGLCPSCNAAFAKSSKELTEKIMENANLIRRRKKPDLTP